MVDQVKILVPFDDIEAAGLALTNGKDIAKATGSSLVLLHVVIPANPLVISDEHLAGVHVAAAVIEQAQRNELVHLADQQSKLPAVADELTSDGVSTSAEAVIGNAHEQIARAVKDSVVGLVILATPGRRGITRALLGSVADGVAHDVDVPVMLVNRS